MEMFEASEAFHMTIEEMFGDDHDDDQDDEDAWRERFVNEEDVWDTESESEYVTEEDVESADKDTEREGEESRRKGETPTLNSSAVRPGEEFQELAGTCEGKVEAQSESVGQLQEVRDKT